MPSSTGYLTVAFIVAGGLFVLLWWMLVRSGDEAPWLPAGLASSVVLLVALSAREVVMRRAWTRYLLENGIADARRKSHSSSSSRSGKKGFSSSIHSAALRTIQKQSKTFHFADFHSPSWRFLCAFRVENFLTLTPPSPLL